MAAQFRSKKNFLLGLMALITILFLDFGCGLKPGKKSFNGRNQGHSSSSIGEDDAQVLNSDSESQSSSESQPNLENDPDDLLENRQELAPPTQLVFIVKGIRRAHLMASLDPSRDVNAAQAEFDPSYNLEGISNIEMAAEFSYAEELAERLVNGSLSFEGWTVPSDFCEFAQLAELQECLQGTLENLTLMMWARQASDAEWGIIAGLYTSIIAEGQAGEHALQAAIQYVMLAPHATHRLVQQQSADRIANANQLIDYLSYVIRGRPAPKQDLFSEMPGKSDVLQRIDRYLSEIDNAALAALIKNWFHIEDVNNRVIASSTLQQFNIDWQQEKQNVAADMDGFIGEVLSGGVFQDLLDADISNRPMISAFMQGDSLDRKGILTHPGYLISVAKQANTNPIKRGVIFRRDVLCRPLPPPPADFEVPEQSDDSNLTFRQEVEQVTSAPGCVGCHQTFNDFGFAFEQFNELGLTRSVDNYGLDIDASGMIDDKNFNGVLGENGVLDQFSSDAGIAECAIKNASAFLTGLPEYSLNISKSMTTAGVMQQNAPALLRQIIETAIVDPFLDI